MRELRNCLERACALSTNDLITEDELTISHQGKLHLVSRSVPENLVPAMALVGAVERAHIEAVLAQAGGHRDRAAAVLRISSRALYRKVREYGLQSGVEEVA